MSLREATFTKTVSHDPDLARAVDAALGWMKRHPGRSTLDAATAAVMGRQVNDLTWADSHSEFGGNRWPEFLDAVRAAAKEG